MAAATLKDQSLSDLLRKNNAYYVPTLSLLEDYISSLGKEFVFDETVQILMNVLLRYIQYIINHITTIAATA